MGTWGIGRRRTRPAFERELAKRARAIREDLQGCTIVGVQEVEGKDAVWEALAQAVGPSFRYDTFESADARDITVGILYDARRVTLRHSDQPQACTPEDYGVDYTFARGPRARPNPCGPGAYPLFDRPPHLADLTVRERGRRPGSRRAGGRQPPEVQARGRSDQRAAAGRTGALRGRAADRAELGRARRLQRSSGHPDPCAVRRVCQPLRSASPAVRPLYLCLQRTFRAAGSFHHESGAGSTTSWGAARCTSTPTFRRNWWRTRRATAAQITTPYSCVSASGPPGSARRCWGQSRGPRRD